MRASYEVNNIVYDTDPCLIFKVMKGERELARYIHEPVHEVKNLIIDLISLGVLIPIESVDQEEYLVKDQKGTTYRICQSSERGNRFGFLRVL